MTQNTQLLAQHLEAIRGCLEQVTRQGVKELASRILDASHIYLSGAGRTQLMVKALAMRLAQIGLAVHVAGDSTSPAIIEGDLLVAASGTGGSRTPLRSVHVRTSRLSAACAAGAMPNTNQIETSATVRRMSNLRASRDQPLDTWWRYSSARSLAPLA